MASLIETIRRRGQAMPRRAGLTLSGLLSVALAAGIGWALLGGPLGGSDGFAQVVVVYPEDASSKQFLAGVKLAAEEVNRDGGLLGEPLVLRLVAEAPYTEERDLKGVVSEAMRLADEISDNPEVIAVVGHGTSASAVPASAVYERRRKLYLATHATATSLNNHRFEYVFSLQPNNADNAQLMAQYALSQGLRRFVVLSDATSYAVETTERFRAAVTREGAEILHYAALSGHGRSLDRLLMFILDNDVFDDQDIDAFFITSSSYDKTARFIQRARALGLRTPILGPESLSARTVELQAGESMRDVAAVSLYDSRALEASGRAFTDAFTRSNSGEEPDYLAAVGYDAIKLLAYTVNKVGSTDSRALADALRLLRYSQTYEGALGPMRFDANGLVTDNHAVIVRHDGERFRTADSFRNPLPRRRAMGPVLEKPGLPNGEPQQEDLR